MLKEGDRLLCDNSFKHDGKSIFIKGNTYIVEKIDDDHIVIIGEDTHIVKMSSITALRTFFKTTVKSRKERIKGLYN